MASVAEVGSKHGGAADATTTADASMGATAGESLDSKFNVFQLIAERPDGTGTTVPDKRGLGVISEIVTVRLIDLGVLGPNYSMQDCA